VRVYLPPALEDRVEEYKSPILILLRGLCTEKSAAAG
jgi:hypothetical protein